MSEFVSVTDETSYVQQMYALVICCFIRKVFKSQGFPASGSNYFFLIRVLEFIKSMLFDY